MDYESEAKLVEKAKEDLRSFSELYRAYVEKIYRYCYYRVGSNEVAEDITSQVFLSAVKNIKKFDTSKGKFSSWLYTNAHNKIIDYFRKKSTKELSFDSVTEPSVGDSNLANYSTDVIKMQVGTVLKKLKKDYQLVISLKYFGDLDIPEIADVMKKKTNNTSVLLHRALKAFRREFKKTFPKSEIFDI
ncbi:MAG: RNA polymerase sigma factor [Candidatus Dojkabacteria bacterium]